MKLSETQQTGLKLWLKGVLITFSSGTEEILRLVQALDTNAFDRTDLLAVREILARQGVNSTDLDGLVKALYTPDKDSEPNLWYPIPGKIAAGPWPGSFDPGERDNEC